MRKKAAVAALTLVVVAFGLYRFGGVRIAMDGSGAWPRFVSTRPDYDALEADRARQRQQPAPATIARDAESQPAAPAPSVEIPQRAGEAAVPPAKSGTGTDVGRPRDSWPDFRGPGRDGRYDGAIRTSWPADGLPLLWKQPIGLGYASFVVADGRAFTIEQRRRQEVVAAYDVDTGREIWTASWNAEFTEVQGGDGPRATPTYHEGRVYALGALGELRALDARTGALAWRRNILEDNGASNLDWGMSAAPLVVDDMVIVLPGGSPGRSVVAYDVTSGAPRWRSLDDQQAYTSPMLATFGGVRQILVVTRGRTVGLAVDDGHLLWEYPWSTPMGISAAQPLLLGNDRVFVSASYGHGAAVFEVVRSGDRWSTRTIWQNTRMKNKFSSSVLREGYIYGLDEAILACLDAATGELKWKGGRYGYGQIVLAGDRIIVLTEDGDVALVRATPERHEELARFPAIAGKTWNHPVIVDGRLLVRNLREMAAFDIRP